LEMEAEKMAITRTASRYSDTAGSMRKPRISDSHFGTPIPINVHQANGNGHDTNGHANGRAVQVERA